MNTEIQKLLVVNQEDLEKKKGGINKVLNDMESWNQKPLSNRRPILPEEQVQGSIFDYDVVVIVDEEVS